MKISTSKDGQVTFQGMEPRLAEALIDLARDLNAGDAVLLYGPDYVPVVRPTDLLRDQFDILLHADNKMLGGLSDVDPIAEDKVRWTSQPLLEETHIQVWEEIFPSGQMADDDMQIEDTVPPRIVVSYSPYEGAVWAISKPDNSLTYYVASNEDRDALLQAVEEVRGKRAANRYITVRYHHQES